MRIRITGIISFLSAIVGFGFGLYGILQIEEGDLNDSSFYFIIIFLALWFISMISIALYVYLTKLGNFYLSKDLDKIENENLLLKKQIEQKELKQKLAD